MRQILLSFAMVTFQPFAQAQASCEDGFEATRMATSSAKSILTECLSSSVAPKHIRGQAFEYRAWLNYQDGNHKEAALDQERSFLLVPKISHRSLLNHSLYLRLGLRHEESLVFAKLAEAVESRERDATSMPTQYHLGWSFFELGRYEEAVMALTRGIPYQPDYSAVYWLRAQAYEKMGESTQAKADLLTLSTLLQTPKGKADIGKWGEAASEKLRAYGVSPP